MIPLGQLFALALAVSALAAQSAAAEPAAPRIEPQRPETVSPGRTDRITTVADGAPTFSWSGASTSAVLELAVYPLPERDSPAGGELKPVLLHRLPSGTSSWTPPFEDALQPGEYAWFLRHRTADVEGRWSEPRLFRVPAGSLAGTTTGHRAPDDADPPGDTEATRSAPRREQKSATDTERDTTLAARRRALGGAVTPQLRVMGNVDATSFTGDGSNLSNIATDAELQAHVGDAAAHTTCHGQPCDGTLFANVTAVAGDSASGFFSTGSLEEARIDAAIARDAEVAALLGGETLIRVAADGTPTENGGALEAAIAGITDASAAKPYTVLLGPGLYDVGADGAQMSPFVNLQGTSRASTIVTGSGDPVSFNDLGTIVLADDVLVERLTVRNTGGANTHAFGVRGSGARWRVQDARIEITSNGADEAVGFSGVNPSGSFEHSGELVRVTIEVDEGNGIGSFTGVGDLVSLRVHDCRIVIQGAGQGISEANFRSFDAALVVTDTTVAVLGGGTGIGVSYPEVQLFRNVIVEVSGGSGSNSGFSDFGSGFRPVIENSRIAVDGTDSAGIRTNNGIVTVVGSTIQATGSASKVVDADAAGPFAGSFAVRNSVIVAAIGFELVTNTGSHFVRVDQTTFDVGTGFRTSSSGGGLHQIRLGSSKLDASSTNVQEITVGSANPVCAASYDENYVALTPTCG